MTEYKKMTEEEIAKRDPAMRHIHPVARLKDLIELLRKVGSKEFLEGAGYNKERDALFGCMFALALRSSQGREFYMQQVSDPPDFELIAPTERPTREKPFDHALVEVVSVPMEADGAPKKLEYVIEILERTKFHKRYEKGTILLIVFRAACGPELVDPLRNWFREHPGEIANFGEIMGMYLTEVSPTESFIYEVVSLSKNWSGNFSLMKEFKKPLIEHPLIEKFGINVE